HNGYNSAAYQQAARNTLRSGLLFPAQYVTGPRRPQTEDLYTHAPLGLHLHTTASVALLGDHNAAVRLVPAVHSVAAVLMLFILVRRHWGDATALLTTFLYTMMPINHTLANMSNHTTGGFVWGLAALYCYLEWIAAPSRAPPDASQAQLQRAGLGWWAGMCVCFTGALLWDWPPHILAFVVALHGLWVSFGASHRRLPRWYGLHRDHLLLALFCLWVVIWVGGFFGLIQQTVGNLYELKHSIQSRSAPVDNVYSRLWDETLCPMFSAPMLLSAVVWGLWRLGRSIRGEPIGRDVVILGYGVAGSLYVLLFKKTALIHIYWPWQFNIVLALTSATLVMAIADALYRPDAGWVRRLVTGVVALGLIGLWVGGFTAFSAPLIPEGRRLAGTFHHQGYKTEQIKVAFFAQVAQWTTFHTGVLVMPHVAPRIEALATLDRIHVWTYRADRFVAPTQHPEITDGWVLVGVVNQTSRRHLLRAAARHPYRQYGPYYMIDYRTQGRDIQIWNLTPERQPALSWWLWYSHHERPLLAERNLEAEERMVKESRRFPIRPPSSSPAPKRPHPSKRAWPSTLHKPPTIPKPKAKTSKPGTRGAKLHRHHHLDRGRGDELNPLGEVDGLVD
ncbi:MAG: glycosyltransferase family 39 protein, partial [Myxococcota bacterium]